MGGAFVAQADDYSAIYWNPAGMAELEGPQVALFAMDVISLGTYEVDFPDALGGGSVDAKVKGIHYFIPNIVGYLPAYRSENLTVGLGAYVPAGHGAEWHGGDLTAFSGPPGTVYKWRSKVDVLNLSPAAAYEFNEVISAGVGLNIFYCMLEMDRPMDMFDAQAQAPGQDGFVDTQYEESGSGFGFGAALGILVKPSEILRVGLSFKTETPVALEGTAKNTAFEALGAPESDYERDLSWPMWIAGGISLTASERLLVAADLHFTRWSDTQDVIETDFKDPTWDAQLDQQGQNKTDLRWEDTFQIRVGAQYGMSETWNLRAGYYYDPSPAPEETANIVLLTNTNHGLTVGATRRRGRLSLDFAFEYLFGVDRVVPFEDGFEMPGTYGGDIAAFGLGIGYSWP
jgi:long-chain fatty acid transport protein